MEIQVTQEHVDRIVREAVSDHIGGMTFYDHRHGCDVSLGEYVRLMVGEHVEDYLREKFSELIDTEIDELARHEVMAQFLNKPVKIDNGWKRGEYDSYNSFLLEYIYERSADAWHVKDSIRTEIERRVDELWKKCELEVKDAILAKIKERIERHGA